MSCFLDRILEREHLVPPLEFGGSDAPVIEFSNVCEYSWHGVLKKNDWRTLGWDRFVSDATPPFGRFWMETKTPSELRKQGETARTWGFLVEGRDYSPITAAGKKDDPPSKIGWDIKPDDIRWVLVIGCCFEITEMWITGPMVEIALPVGHRGQLLLNRDGRVAMAIKVFWFPEFQSPQGALLVEQFGRQGQRMAAAVLLAISWMNSKRVRLQDTRLDDALQAKRRREGRRPLAARKVMVLEGEIQHGNSYCD